MNEKKDIATFKVDDFFTTQEMRDEEKKEHVEELDISILDNFPNHPFKVINNDEMKKLRDSIKDNGVLEPIIVRKKDDNRYEIVSGHRRKLAAELVGLKKIPCIIRNMDRDSATVYMVDSNMHREHLLPSEKAFAYKMKLDALNHQGKASSQLGTKLSAEEIGNETGDSKNQVYRYIRLTNLIPEILEKVDNDEIAFNPAVEISYLTKEHQKVLLESMDYNDCTPSHAQSIILKKLSQNGELTDEKIMDILEQEKPNQVLKFKFNRDKLKQVLPKNIEDSNVEDYVIKAVDYYTKHRERSMER